FHVVVYGMLRFAPITILDIHFLHQYAILFVAEVGIMIAIGVLRPRTGVTEVKDKAQVDTTPWRYRVPTSFTLGSCVIALYLLFSPLGLASPDGPGGLYLSLTGLVVLMNVGVWSTFLRAARQINR
ncbi:MAG: solute:sodium symporter family transporter, partial [Pseudomonadota bacterium]